MELDELDYHKGLVEAFLFGSSEPLSLAVISKLAGLDKTDAEIIMQSLLDEYEERDGGIVLREIAGAFQLLTNEKYGEKIAGSIKEKKKENLSKAAMEILSIIAYKQPLTIPELDELRGAGSRATVFQLIKKKLVKGYGKKNVPGHPTLYVTTAHFLVLFSLNSLADLPTLEEIRNLNFDKLD